VKATPTDAPAKAAFPDSWLGRAESGGLVAVWGDPHRPFLPAWLRGLGAAQPSSNETPARAGGVSRPCLAPFRAGSLWPRYFWGSGRAFLGICSPPRFFEELGEPLIHGGEIRRRGDVGSTAGSWQVVSPSPLKNPDPNTRAAMLWAGEHRNFP